MSIKGHLLRVREDELETYLMDSSLLKARIYETAPGEDSCHTALDKAWDGILFLLTAEDTDHPLAKILFSGQVIDENQDMGYGPAYFLTSEQVVVLYKELALITYPFFKQQYDADKMNESGIYPEIWEYEDACDYLWEYFEKLRQAFAEAATRKEILISFLN